MNKSGLDDSTPKNPEEVYVKENQKIIEFTRLLLDKAILVLLIGAIGYYLGLRFLLTYYYSFGIDASFLRFTPTEVASAGWRTFLLMFLIILFAIFLFLIIKRIFLQSFSRKKQKPILSLFFISLSAGLVFVLLSAKSVFTWGTYLTRDFFIMAFIGLFFFGSPSLLEISCRIFHPPLKKVISYSG